MLPIKLTELARYEGWSDDELAAVEEVVLDADGADIAALPRALDLLETRLPALRGLGIQTTLLTAVNDALRERPQLAARVQALALHAKRFGRLPDGGYGDLFAAPEEWLALMRAHPGIRSLTLYSPDLSTEAAREGLLDALANMRALESMSLFLDRDPPTTLSVLALLERLPPATLQSLYVASYQTIGDDPIESRAFTALRSLTLIGPELSREDVTRLLGAIGAAPLQQLCVDATPEGLSTLASARACAELRELSTSGLTDEAAAILASAPFFPRLRRLDVLSGELGFAGVRDLFHAHERYALTELSLASSDNDWDYALELLAESPALAGLERLELSDSGIKGAGVKALCAAPGPLRLRVLDLSHNKIGMTGARALANWHHADKIEGLTLIGTKLPPKARALLRDSPLAEALLL